MSRSSIAHDRPSEEVKRLDRDESAEDAAVRNLHRVPLVMAKVGMGAAIGQAIGTGSRKQFGTEGLVSGLISGEKVPDYLAHIYEDKGARRRLAMALLQDDERVRMRVVVEIEPGALDVPLTPEGIEESRVQAERERESAAPYVGTVTDDGRLKKVG